MLCFAKAILCGVFVLSTWLCAADELRGLNVIVTGGSRGIGEACCYALAREGANVVVAVDKSLDEAEEVVEKIKTYGVDAFFCQCDVSNPDDVQSMVDEVIRRWRSVDILVNNAGIAHVTPAENLTLEEWNRMIDINLTGVFLCSQAVGRSMIKQGKGGFYHQHFFDLRAYCSSSSRAVSLQCSKRWSRDADKEFGS